MSLLNTLMGNSADNSSDNLGNRMESHCNVEIRPQQPYGMVRMYNRFQYGRNPADHISAHPQAEQQTIIRTLQ